MKKVVITGANGFLGSNLVRHLAGSGREIVALVDARFDYSALRETAGVTCIEFELSHLSRLDGHPALADTDTLYHLAWEGVNSTYKNESEIQAMNVLYSLSVLELAKNNRIYKVVVPGSASEYALGGGVINGKSLPAPSDLYSASKVAARFLCQTYARQQGIELVWTAITSVYGPGRNDNNLITYAIKSLLRGECPQFTGLRQQWDYLYVSDLIVALEALGERGQGGKVYPVGSGIHCPMAEYVKIIRDLIDPSLPLGIGALPYKNAQIDHQILDISDLRDDTGFAPAWSFEAGIRETIRYFQAQITSA